MTYLLVLVYLDKFMCKILQKEIFELIVNLPYVTFEILFLKFNKNGRMFWTLESI